MKFNVDLKRVVPLCILFLHRALFGAVSKAGQRKCQPCRVAERLERERESPSLKGTFYGFIFPFMIERKVQSWGRVLGRFETWVQGSSYLGDPTNSFSKTPPELMP